jgi:rhodanese-related sulfurtransferase
VAQVAAPEHFGDFSHAHGHARGGRSWLLHRVHGLQGAFAALVLAQMGFRPIVLERGKAVRERTQGHLGAVAQECA